MKKIKTSILVVVLILLVGFVFSPLNEVKFVKVFNVGSNSQTISFDEMNSFLEVWSQYINSDVSKIGISSLSLAQDSAKENLPPRVNRWLLRRNWNPNRFFYVETRLKAIIKSIELQQRIQSNENMLRLLGKSSDKEAYNTMVGLISQQRQQANVEKISEEEINLVKPNVKVIKEIMEGRSVYIPNEKN